MIFCPRILLSKPRKVMEMKFTPYISMTQRIQVLQLISQLPIMSHLLRQPKAALRKKFRFKTRAPLRTRLPKVIKKEEDKTTPLRARLPKVIKKEEDKTIPLRTRLPKVIKKEEDKTIRTGRTIK